MSLTLGRHPGYFLAGLPYRAPVERGQTTSPCGRISGYRPARDQAAQDDFLFGRYYTGEPRNRSHVRDPALDDLLVRQRRAMDVKTRREIINEIQRHLAKQQYYVHAPPGTYVAVWDGR